MMHRSLCEVIATADGATRVYCGHEYTVSNLLFATHLEPGNREVRTALDRARALRAAGLPTVPGSLADERRTNPFLRCASAGIRKAVSVEGDDVAVLAAVRAAKDVFRAS